MNDADRPRRPPMKRTGPDRAWSGVFGPPADAAGQTSPPSDRTSGANGSGQAPGGDPSHSPRFATNAGAAGGLEDAITRSVEIGYRVIDDYLRQGREVARNLRTGQATPESIVRDTGDLATRMMRYASDFVGTWLELFEIAAARGNGISAGNAAARATFPAQQAAASPSPYAAGENGAAAAQPAVPASSPARPEPARVDLVVVTRRRVEASVRLEERSVGRLRVHALRCADANVARISDVEVLEGAGDQAAPSIRVTIPDEQPPGVYEGLILDDARNLPVGVVRVAIRE